MTNRLTKASSTTGRVAIARDARIRGASKVSRSAGQIFDGSDEAESSRPNRSAIGQEPPEAGVRECGITTGRHSPEAGIIAEGPGGGEPLCGGSPHRVLHMVICSFRPVRNSGIEFLSASTRPTIRAISGTSR